jgi:rhomboid protease GluP
MSQDRSQPWVVYALIAANVAMFGVELASGADPIAPGAKAIIELGGSYPPLTLHGEWWRLGSSMFLHFGIVHLAMNMLCLYQVRAVEPAFGRLGFLVIYLLAGLGGGIASLIANTGNVVVAGASGAVFGAYGAFGAKLVLHRAQLEPEVWQRTMRRLATFLALNAVVGLTARGISISAHVGGLLVGGALGAALLAGAGAARARTRRALGLAAAGLALTAIGVLTIKADPGVMGAIRHFDTLEHSAITRWRATLERANAGQATDAEHIAFIDHELIPPYRQLREELRATSDAPARLRPVLVSISELVAARLAAWEALRPALAEKDATRRAQLMEAYARANAEVIERVKAETAEVEALKEK